MKIIRLEEATEWPQIGPLSPEDLKEAYALARAAFTADDLQKFTEIDEGVPMETFLEELAQAEIDYKRNH